MVFNDMVDKVVFPESGKRSVDIIFALDDTFTLH